MEVQRQTADKALRQLRHQKREMASEVGAQQCCITPFTAVHHCDSSKTPKSVNSVLSTIIHGQVCLATSNLFVIQICIHTMISIAGADGEGTG